MTHLLAGDIGGTKTLLSLYRVNGDQLELLANERYSSAGWSDLSLMVLHFLKEVDPEGSFRPSAACFAVAGPVQGGQARLTNLDWQLSEAELARYCAIPTVELVNDFAVLLHGLPHLARHQLATVRDGFHEADAPVLVLGAGTGLGVSIGVPRAGSWLALASEAAHGEFAPRSQAEWDLKEWLRSDLELDRLSIERVVSGTGLGHVARWLLARRHPDGDHPLWDEARRWMDPTQAADLPAAVSDACDRGDPLAAEAMHLWLGAYGSVAGDLALCTLCRGGLWLTGGTAPKLLGHLRSPTFIEAFLGKGRLRDALLPIPIQAILDPSVGSFSAACRARELSA